MNCQEFIDLVSELACDRPLDASIEQDARRHTTVCDSCAQLLAAQRMLTARILEFAEATGNLHTSPQVKQRLRAEVTKRKIAQNASLGTSIRAAMGSVGRAIWPRWVVAAAISACLMVTTVWWWTSTTPVQEQLAGAQPPAAKEIPKTSPTVEPVAPATPHPQVVARQSPQHQPQRRTPKRNRPTVSEVEGEEFASAFVPLTLSMDEKAIENGTIVRLEVPRTKLIAMGLPLHVDGDQETVNAEVMLGDNGVAYAIRVVR